MNKGFQFLIYNTPQENIKIDVVVKEETIWLTQKAEHKAHQEYDAFNKHQNIISDFDKTIKLLGK